MWHTRSIEHRCPCCTKRATVELFNERNASYGYFCQRCADRRIKREAAIDEKEARERENNIA